LTNVNGHNTEDFNLDNFIAVCLDEVKKVLEESVKDD